MAGPASLTLRTRSGRRDEAPRARLFTETAPPARAPWSRESRASRACSAPPGRLPPFAQKNIAETPLVGGQWRLGEGAKYDIVITDNKTAPAIPVGGKMEPIG
jgi:hypothetical protein